MKTSALLVPLIIAGIGIGGITAASAMSGKPGGSHPSVTGDRDRCFDTTFISSFQTLSDNKVIIVSDRDQAYQLTLGGVCIGLDTSFMIGIRSRMGNDEVCGPFDADIVYNDMGGIREHQECPITDVRHLSPEEAAPYVGGRSRASTSSSSR